MGHIGAQAIVISCIDLRFQKFVEDWTQQNVGEGKYDRVAWAGGIKDLGAVMSQVEISIRLHATKTAIFINHEDCGAYGDTGTPEKHREDLLVAKQTALERHPNLHVDLYYLHLNGTFEPISDNAT